MNAQNPFAQFNDAPAEAWPSNDNRAPSSMALNADSFSDEAVNKSLANTKDNLLISGSNTDLQMSKAVAAEDSPFSQFGEPTIAPPASGLGTATHTLERGVAPTLTGMAAASAGAEAGAAAGVFVAPFTGPLAPLTEGAFTLVGGIAGFWIGSAATNIVQDAAIHSLPMSAQRAISQDQIQREAEGEQFPMTQFVSELAPQALVMGPFAGVKAAVTDGGASAISRILSNPATAHLAGGLFMAGTEAISEHEAGKPLDPLRIGVATSFGLFFAHPTRLGTRLGDSFKSASSKSKNVNEPKADPTPTDLADMKIAGPGITEDVFNGSMAQSPSTESQAKTAAQDAMPLKTPTIDLHATARSMEPELFTHYDGLSAQRDSLRQQIQDVQHPSDEAVTALQTQKDDLQKTLDAHRKTMSGTNNAKDRQLRAQIRDIDSQATALQSRRDAFNAGQGQDAPEVTGLRQRLMETDATMRDMASDVSAAYRRAAEAHNSETIAPFNDGVYRETIGNEPQGTTSETQPSIKEGSAKPSQNEKSTGDYQAIVDDVTKSLIAAGRPADEAHAAAQIVASHTVARAERFKGALGTPLELHRREGSAIVGQVQKQMQAPQPAPEPQIGKPIPEALTHYQDFNPSEIGVDAKRFQFKGGGDEKGVVSTLKNVKKWDQNKAGTVIVWQDKAGKNWVVDGHQRIGLGARAEADGQNPKVHALLWKEADGITADEAKVMAADINISQGSGTPLDAAKVLRAHPEMLGNLPKNRITEHGKGLARLSDDAFGMVANGFVPEEYAALVGKIAPNPDTHAQIMEVLAKNEPENAAQAESMIRDVLTAPEVEETTTDMFGTAQQTQILFKERAQVLSAAATALRKDRAAFNTLVNEEDRLTGAGNQLATATNAERAMSDAEILITLQATAHRKGPVADALAIAAKAVHDGQKTAAAVKDFLGNIRSEVGRSQGHGTSGDAAALSEGQRLEPRDTQTVEMFQQDNSPFTEELGPDGKPQTIVPGAEKITQAELMQRGADARLRAKVAQKPLEHGLFGDSADQKTLFQGVRGKIRIAPGQRPIITLMRDANASTFMHESGHQWLEEIMRDENHAQAPNDLKVDAQTVRKWLGAKKGENITVRQHEKFARGFEQYLREGVSPSKGLTRVFDKFKNWLTSIYQTTKNLGAPINDDIRQVFDRLITSEPRHTVMAPDRELDPHLSAIHTADAAETHPHHAEPVMDRVTSERDQFASDLHPDIKAEHETAIARLNADATGQTGQSAAGREPVDPSGPRPEPDAGGQPSGGTSGDQQPSNSAAGREGNGMASGTGAGHESAIVSGSPTHPNALFGPPTSPLIDKAGNIRLDKMNTPEDLKQVMRDIAKANDGFLDARRNVVTTGMLVDLAEKTGITSEILAQRKVGEAYNGEQILAIGNLAIDAAAQVRNTASLAHTPEGKAAFGEAVARMTMIQSHFSGVTAEAGRALHAIKVFQKMSGAKDLKQLTELMKGTGRTLFQLEELAQGILQMSDSAQVARHIADSRKPGFWDNILEARANGLISGIATHTTYYIGNLITNLIHAVPETAMAATIGAARKALGREGSQVRFGEVGQNLKAFSQSVAPGIKGTIETVRYGAQGYLPGEKPWAPFYQKETATQFSKPIDADATFKDAIGALYSMFQGIREGLINTAAQVKAGGTEGAPLFSWKQSPLGAIPNIAYRGTTVVPLGDVMRIPSRGVSAMHTLNRVTSYAMELNAIAFRMASDEGLVGQAFERRVADIRANPTNAIMNQSIRAEGEPPASAASAAADFATDIALMGSGKEFTKMLNQLANKRPLGVPVARLIMPFITVASNVMEKGLIERTPLAFMSPEIRADLMGKNGNVAQDRAYARVATGSIMALTYIGFRAEGFMTGSPSDDPNTAANDMRAGHPPFSARIGDFWYQYNKLGPIGLHAALSADLYDAAHAANDGDLAKASGELLNAITHPIMNEGFARGISDLTLAMHDKRYAQQYVQSFAATFVPFAIGLQQMDRATDPYSRRAKTTLDQIKKNIPGLSEGLLPNRDIWGEPIKNRQVLGVPGFSSIYKTPVTQDPVDKTFMALGFWPGKVENRIRDVHLTDQEYDDYARIAGRATKITLNKLVLNPDFMRLHGSEKHKLLLDVVSGAREMARGQIMTKYPHILKDSYAAKSAKFTGDNTE